MGEFNLKAEIRKVVDTTDLASPDDIAAKVVENIPAKLLRSALMQCLPELVRVELGRARGLHPITPQSYRSSKVAGIRAAAEDWRRRLRDRVHVGRGVWLLLADCSAENFRFAAEERRVNAERSLAAADQYNRFGAACEKHSVARFADLPEAVQAQLLGGEEAAA